MKNKLLQIIGVIGTLILIIVFITHPSFPTPDKILVFLTFIFLAIGQATDMLKRLLPFVLLLLLYESFRGVAEQLNTRVEYTWMINVDKMLYGNLPTVTLQKWFWNGAVQWYDFVFYIFYMLHFAIPIILAILIWKYREKFYWQYVTTIVALSFAGFLTFLAFPAAPPWMAVRDGYITEPLTRISSSIWAELGITDFPSVYNKISPNAVAAVPSLHAAYATLIAIFVFMLFGKKWGALTLIYPLIIYFGTVYSGEHYAIDEILGIIYAVVIFIVVHVIFNKLHSTKNRKNIHAVRET